MRILFNGLMAGNRSGTGRYINELLKALHLESHDHDIRCVWPLRHPAPNPEMERLLLRRSAASRHRFLFEQYGAGRLGQKTGCTATHYPASIGPVLPYIPSIITVHDLCYRHHPEWFSHSRRLYYRAFMGPSIRKACHIITDSQASADDVTRFLGVPGSRISVIPLGVDTLFKPATQAECEQVRRRYGIPDRFYLFVGTIEPRKNLERLVAAWNKIVDRAPDLVVAGRRGWKVAPGRWTNAAENPHRIHWIDHVPQEHLPALYSAATAFVWPSLMEGFGLPVLEAMACKTPVLTSNSSSLPEVAGNAAWCVDPCDVAAIAEGMLALSEDAALRAQLIEAGRRRAAMFSWRQTARGTIAVYDRVAESVGG